MDTRFWGPSGWKLLHSIAYTYPEIPSQEDKTRYGIFLSNLKFVLPCKYCRKSLTSYYRSLPVEEHLESGRALSKWIYHIHNKVNGKLRRQGLLKTENPSLEEVDKMYKEIVDMRCALPGWDFIYCVAFNYPEKAEDVTMDLTNYYLTFFKYLGYVIPCKKYRSIYKKVYHNNPLEDSLTDRQSLTKWLHRINCNINQAFTEKNRSYKNIMESFESFRAGCHKKTYKGITCRKLRKKSLHKNKKEQIRLARIIS